MNPESGTTSYGYDYGGNLLTKTEGRESRKRNVEIFGVDAFRLISELELQPDMEHSLDVSLEHFANFTREEKLAVAERFVEARLSTDLYFEMAPGDPA